MKVNLLGILIFIISIYYPPILSITVMGMLVYLSYVLIDFVTALANISEILNSPRVYRWVRRVWLGSVLLEAIYKILVVVIGDFTGKVASNFDISTIYSLFTMYIGGFLYFLLILFLLILKFLKKTKVCRNLIAKVQYIKGEGQVKKVILLGLNVIMSFALIYQLIYWHHWNAKANFFYLGCILIVFWGILLSYLKRSNKKNPWLLSSAIRNYYRKELTRKEMNIFLKQMHEMQQTMLQFEHLFEEEVVLNQLNKKYDVLENLLFIYTYIIKHPKELLQFSHLLYKQLPSLTVMLSKYTEINHHYFIDTTSKQHLDNTYKAMEKIMREIKQLSLKLQGEKQDA